MTDNSYKAQLAVLSALQGHEVDSLIDCLVEKLGLVKFLLKDGRGNPMEAAATHVVEAILSYLSDRGESTSARKRFEKTQLQRVFFMVANLTLASLNGGPDRASLLMQTCIIVDRHCPELKDTAIGLAGGGGAVMAGGHACAGDPATKVPPNHANVSAPHRDPQVARELYIGNMSEGTTEMSMVTFFNEEMNKRGENREEVLLVVFYK